MNEQQEQRDGQWFIFKGEQHRGPYKTDEMVNLFALGVIGHRDLVWREGGGTWLPFADHAVFREIIFKEGAKEVEEERPPVEVPLPSVNSEQSKSTEVVLPDLPPVPDDVDVALEEVPEDIQVNEAPVLPEQPNEEVEVKVEIEKTSPSLSFQDAIIDENDVDDEDEDAPRFAWGKLVAGVAFVIALVVSGLWFMQFRLQTYDLIGLESADVASFNAVLLNSKADHIVRVTKDGNVIWAASPGVIEGEAYLNIESIPGRVLSTDPIKVSSLGAVVQGLVPFKKFEFAKGEKWVQGDYSYQFDVRPKGPIARLASVLAPYPWFNKLSWVKNHSHGHSYSGTIHRYETSARAFEDELAGFREKIWDSMSKPLKARLEKYQTLKQLAWKTRELWFQRLSVAVTWRAFKKYDAGYGRDIAPVLQELVIDSVKTAQANQENSPLIARLFQEVEETGKQLGELASVMSKSSRAVRQYKKSDKVRLTEQFEEMWGPLIQKIDGKINSLESEYKKLEAAYSPKE